VVLEGVTFMEGQLEYRVPIGEVKVSLRKFVFDYLVVVITQDGLDRGKT
jgi:hypothetical protein